MDREILNMEEAAELFGVSIKTFIKLLKEEKIPARKIGREWRFSRSALINWLSSGDSQAYSSSEGDTRDFFNQVAHQWGELRRFYFDDSVINKIIDMQLLKKDMTIMDLGSGDGYLSRALAGYVGKVVAVDISSEMLKELDRKAKQSGIENIEILESDGQDVPLPDSNVDVACANMFLHHIEEPENAIKEMYRVLKPGGIVIVADLYEHTNEDLKEKMHDIWTGFKPEDLKKWFKGVGFGDISVEAVNRDEAASVKERLFIIKAEKNNM